MRFALLCAAFAMCTGQTPKSCSDILANNVVAASGTYSIAPAGLSGSNTPISVTCDMVTSGGGWTLVAMRDSATADTVGADAAAVTTSQTSSTYNAARLTALKTDAVDVMWQLSGAEIANSGGHPTCVVATLATLATGSCETFATADPFDSNLWAHDETTGCTGAGTDYSYVGGALNDRTYLSAYGTVKYYTPCTAGSSSVSSTPVATGHVEHQTAAVYVRHTHAASGCGTAASGTACSGASLGDPHLHLAHGGSTDYRGRDRATVNMLSAPNISLGLRISESYFQQQWKDNPDCLFLNCDAATNLQTVNGTHFTKAFLVLRSRLSAHLVHVSLDAEVSPWQKPYATVEPINFKVPDQYAKRTFSPRHSASAVKLSTDQATEFVHEDLRIYAPNNHRVSISAAGWLVNVTRRRLAKPLPQSKTKSYLDIVVQPLSATSHTLAHGLIGQSFSFDGPRTEGKKDDYSKPEVTTSAQGEGAIEGVGTDYELASDFEVRFKFSRFDSTAQPVPRTAFVRSGAGSTETDEAAEPKDVA